MFPSSYNGFYSNVAACVATFFVCRRSFLLFVFFFAFSPVVFGEGGGTSDSTRKHGLSSGFHASRRQALRDSLPENSAAVFFAAPDKTFSNDVKYEFHQDRDFYYLSGLEEPLAVLMVFKDSIQFGGMKSNELLFLRKRDPRMEVWMGVRTGVEGARNKLEVAASFPNDSLLNGDLPFEKLEQLLLENRKVPVDKDPSNNNDLHGLMNRVLRQAREKDVETDKITLSSFMASLRVEKQEEEMVLLKEAVSISANAHNQLMKALEPGMGEFEAEAIVEYWFRKNGCSGPGYPSIVGSGENACILHYEANKDTIRKEDMVVVDVGGMYKGYTADITRTLPADGKFSKEQAAIYDLVLKAQQAGIDSSIVGNTFWDPHKAALEVIRKGLVDLGVMEKENEVRNYFMHGTSHYLGLDVHDVGLRGPLAPGQVITVEPGIYIAEGSDCDEKWWNIGVRIEDDILITNDGPVNLSKEAPLERKDVERMMKKKSPLNDL